MIAAPEIDCVWLCGPNHLRVQNMEAICDAIQSGRGKLIGIACEKPLARNVAEARRMVQLVEQSGLLHGYLEDQIFAPGVTEYSLSINSLDSGLKLFMSRKVKGAAGEDLVEKQNAEQGLMPVLGNEATEYGYESQDRYFVQCFLDGKQPEESFYDGLEITELLMTAYMSAEQERTIKFRPEGLETYVPLVAQGLWQGE
jgi:predicted dehydrogenase